MTSRMREVYVCVTLLTLAALACGPLAAVLDVDELARSGGTGFEQATVEELVAQVTGEGDLEAGALAVQEVLARSGIATGDLVEAQVEAHQPASAMMVLPYETWNAAMELRGETPGWSLDAAEYGQALAGLGWPVPEGTPPGTVIVELLAEWVRFARQNPEDPASFTALFLHELAARRDPAVDLSAGSAAPEQVRFSLLELLLIGGTFDRGLDFETAGQPPAGGRSGLARPAAGSSAAALALQGACTQFQERMFGKSTVGNVARFATGFGFGKLVDAALGKAGVSTQGVEKYGAAMFSLNMATRVARAAMLARYASINVQVEGQREFHRAQPGEELKSTFSATAGISKQDWDRYQQTRATDVNTTINDCLDALGLPKGTSLGELGAEVQNWSVEWRILKSGEEHLMWSPRQQSGPGAPHQGYWRTPLAMSAGGGQGASRFVVQIKSEKPENHPGVELEEPARVCAELDVTQPPNVGVFGNALVGGLAGAADSAVELMTGMFQKLAKPSACADLQISFHERLRLEIVSHSLLEQSFPMPGGSLDVRAEWYGEGLMPLESVAEKEVEGNGLLPVELTETITGPNISCSGSGTEEIPIIVKGTVDTEAQMLHLTLEATPASMTGTGSCQVFSASGTTDLDVGPATKLVERFSLPLEEGASRTLRYPSPLGEHTLTITLRRSR